MRNRVKLAFIENKNARKSSCKKRINGLFKKMNDITTICGIWACAILYCPESVEPYLWPADPGQVEGVIDAFVRRNGYDDTGRKMDRAEYVGKLIEKSEKELNKMLKEKRRMEMNEKMFECLPPGSSARDQLEWDDFADLLWVIDGLVSSIDGKIASLNQSARESVAGVAVDAAVLGGDVAVVPDQIVPEDL